jgi:hypothetical protein
VPARKKENALLMKNICIILILAGCCIVCKDEQPTQSPQQTPYEQWRSQNLHYYTIDQRRICFCPYGGETVRITVRSDTIAQVTRISDTSAVQYQVYISIDSLFGIIRNSKTDSLVVRYNSEYGYPEYLDINPQQHPYDGGELFETSNLQIP